MVLLRERSEDIDTMIRWINNRLNNSQLNETK